MASDLIQTMFVRILQDGLHLWTYWVPFLVIEVVITYYVPFILGRITEQGATHAYAHSVGWANQQFGGSWGFE